MEVCGVEGKSLTLQLTGYRRRCCSLWSTGFHQDIRGHYRHSNTSTPSWYCWSLCPKPFDNNYSRSVTKYEKMAVHGKEDGYHLTSLRGKSASMRQCLSSERLVSCQWLGDKSKISTSPLSPFAGENYTLPKTIMLLSEDENVGKQIYPRSQFIVRNTLICHTILNQEKEISLQNSKAWCQARIAQHMYVPNQNSPVRGTKTPLLWLYLN